MQKKILIGLVGHYDAKVPAHQAIPIALEIAGASMAIRVDFQWVPTEEINNVSRVSEFDGLWCVPGSPYRDMEGALSAIRYARENGRPFLGTCGGFQHAVIEYARNVLGWEDAEHAETAPDAVRAVISPLECALVEATDTVYLFPNSRLANAYGTDEVVEGYRCRYGLNPEFREALVSGALRAVAVDATGEVRGVELDGHPFFVATLFQPERAALKGKLSPIVEAFIFECASNAAQQVAPSDQQKVAPSAAR